VGWAMSERMPAQLINDALLMAIWKRKPSKGLVANMPLIFIRKLSKTMAIYAA
jgi:transposase InsO family protein